MSRNVSASFEAALLDQNLRPCLFFEGDFPSGSLHLWTGTGSVEWNGETWTGAGNLIGISDISETTDVVASGATITMSGIPVDLVSTVISDAQQGLPGKVYVGLLDDAGELIVDPIAAFVGRLDVPTIVDGAETCAVSVTYESRLIDLQSAREWRYTHESQQVLSPGDLGFEYITSLQDKDISWGQ